MHLPGRDRKRVREKGSEKAPSMGSVHVQPFLYFSLLFVILGTHAHEPGVLLKPLGSGLELHSWASGIQLTSPPRDRRTPKYSKPLF